MRISSDSPFALGLDILSGLDIQAWCRFRKNHNIVRKINKINKIHTRPGERLCRDLQGKRMQLFVLPFGPRLRYRVKPAAGEIGCASQNFGWVSMYMMIRFIGLELCDSTLQDILFDGQPRSTSAWPSWINFQIAASATKKEN